MEQPKKIPGTRLCLVVTKSGLKAYGNASALKSLASWLEWVAASNPAEHFECHVEMDLESDESKFEGKVPRNVWVLLQRELAGTLDVREKVIVEGEPVDSHGFGLTFMAVSESELDDMARLQSTGILPDSWDKL